MARPATATAVKAGMRPTMAAALPKAGPRRAPTTAALSITPISSPRRSSGARATSHVKAATHERALPNPPTNRVTTSSHVSSASANPTLVRLISARPTRAAALTPTREAT
jgi:hypothetical protein